MAAVFVAVVLSLAVPYVSANFNYPANCAPPNSTQLASNVTGPMPPVPTLPMQFQTRVEANLMEMGQTIVAEEYYDDVNNRAVVRTIQNNSMDYMFLDYSINRIAAITNGNCKVTDLELDPNQLLFGLKDGPSGIPHIYTTSDALHFAKSNGLLYMGKTTIRGITVDHWQSCMSWPILGSNFTLDYYFTARNWTDPVLYPQIPVRAEAIGYQQLTTKSKSFHHIYEYFDFRTKLWADPSVFDVPPNIICPHLVYPSNCAPPNTTLSSTCNRANCGWTTTEGCAIAVGVNISTTTLFGQYFVQTGSIDDRSFLCQPRATTQCTSSHPLSSSPPTLSLGNGSFRPNTSACSYPAGTLLYTGGQAPPLPKLPPQFQARVEANLVDRGLTVTATEYYDENANMAALHTLQNSTKVVMVLDYVNNQIYTVTDGVCKVTDLQLDANSQLFGLKGSSSMPHVYSTPGALHFAQSNGLTYIGPTMVRGISVDHWQSCIYWPDLASNFTLDYYFTVQNWIDPVLRPQIPVRAEIVGSQTVMSSRYFHHIYEYYDFRPSIDVTQSAFETPLGSVCPGRKKTKPVPQLAGQYSYREEIVTPGATQVSMADVWYDYSYKLVRFDYRPAYSNYPYFTLNPVTEIHDYSSGVAYAIDRALGNCSIIPLRNATFDAALNISKTINNNQTQFVIRMKSPSQLFYLDNTSYTYEGQSTIRDMLCDVYVSKRSDFKLPTVSQPFNSTFVFYFLADPWVSSNNVGRANAMNLNVPVRLDITADSWVGYQASYNIYNFDQEDPATNRFDVTSCYDDFSKQPFIVEFAGNYDDSLNQYKSNFLQATIDTLARMTHLARIRIQKAEFHIEPDNAYFVGSLMDAPSPLAFFQKIPGVFKRYSNDLSKTVTSAYDCATSCNNGDVTPCNSFEYCPGTNLCTLSKNHASDGATVNNQGTCDYYARAVKSEAFEMPLAQAWKTLKNLVAVGDFRITVNVNGNPQPYTATNVDQNVILGGQRQVSTQQALQNYNVQINKAIPGYDDLILTGTAVDECASSCQNQEEWICNSFEYCFDTGYCVLSKLHPDERPGIVKNKALCDLYSRKYTANYEMIQGTTVLSSSNAIYQNIYTADECGKLCDNYNAFSCKSFDFCPDLSTCYLGKTHYYDVPDANKQLTPMCNHYSRNYLYDFKRTQRKNILNRDDRIILGINVTMCAKQCVEEESFSCASFDYCGNTTECRLSTASMKNIGQVSVTPSLYCDIYNRETFPDGTPYINNPQKYYATTPAPTNSKYTAGAMAGIGFGMLIVGLILAVVLYFVVAKVRGKPVDNMTISFVKQQEAES